MAPGANDDDKGPSAVIDGRHEDAFDDEDDDLDDEFAELQRIQSAKRREAKDKAYLNRIQEILPFAFAPNIRPLGISDLQSAIVLENAAFSDPRHRASPEKFEYRLTTCPELSMGVFHTVVPDQVRDDMDSFPTLSTAHPVETDRPDQAKSVLLGHIVATASHSESVLNSDMEVPAHWRTVEGKNSDKGHVEGGHTICLHSLAILPKLQGCGLGKLVMKSFLQQMQIMGARRVALICQEYLVSYYERFGFKHLGKSNAAFGGGGWHDMVFDFQAVPSSAPAANASSS